MLTTPDLKIQITRYKVIKADQKGNEYGKKPVIAFWYKTTNLSGAKADSMTAFIFTPGVRVAAKARAGRGLWRRLAAGLC